MVFESVLACDGDCENTVHAQSKNAAFQNEVILYRRVD